eukprot:GHVN01097455.1.p1 GENE.GHVN01097455.1~~GHVN01097455.1.p1  ORF type:complete len:490 (+),score=52.20 GHVN01097455.1:2705-4174(+)
MCSKKSASRTVSKCVINKPSAPPRATQKASPFREAGLFCVDVTDEQDQIRASILTAIIRNSKLIQQGRKEPEDVAPKKSAFKDNSTADALILQDRTSVDARAKQLASHVAVVNKTLQDARVDALMSPIISNSSHTAAPEKLLQALEAQIVAVSLSRGPPPAGLEPCRGGKVAAFKSRGKVDGSKHRVGALMCPFDDERKPFSSATFGGASSDSKRNELAGVDVNIGGSSLSVFVDFLARNGRGGGGANSLRLDRDTGRKVSCADWITRKDPSDKSYVVPRQQSSLQQSDANSAFGPIGGSSKIMSCADYIRMRDKRSLQILPSDVASPEACHAASQGGVVQKTDDAFGEEPVPDKSERAVAEARGQELLEKRSVVNVRLIFHSRLCGSIFVHDLTSEDGFALTLLPPRFQPGDDKKKEGVLKSVGSRQELWSSKDGSSCFLRLLNPLGTNGAPQASSTAKCDRDGVEDTSDDGWIYCCLNLPLQVGTNS